MLFIDLKLRSLNVAYGGCMGMTPFWPFKKKPRKSRLRKNDYTENIVEYERTTSSKKTDKDSHLKDEKFLNALKILDRKSKD